MSSTSTIEINTQPKKSALTKTLRFQETIPSLPISIQILYTTYSLRIWVGKSILNPTPQQPPFNDMSLGFTGSTIGIHDQLLSPMGGWVIAIPKLNDKSNIVYSSTVIETNYPSYETRLAENLCKKFQKAIHLSMGLTETELEGKEQQLDVILFSKISELLNPKEPTSTVVVESNETK